MPTLTRLFIKFSFISLILGMTVGIWQLVPSLTLPGLFPVYVHLLTYGWLTQLIFGIALWMFPKYSSEKPRGNQWLGWVTFITLNAGLLLRVIFEPLNTILPSSFSGWMLVTAAVLSWVSVVSFFANTWKRVKEK